MNSKARLLGVLLTCIFPAACNMGAEHPYGMSTTGRNNTSYATVPDSTANGSNGGGSTSGTFVPMQRRSVCEQTQCEAEVAACEQRTGGCRGGCYGDCFHYSRSSSPETQRFCRQLCNERCGNCDQDCSNDTRCARSTYRFRLGSPDLAMRSACLASNQAHARCAATFRSDNCDVLASIGSDALRSAYECSAARACTAEEQSCEFNAAGTLGDELCSALGACDASICNDEARNSTNTLSAILRSDVLAAARSCLQEATCNDAARCLQAWQQAISGQ